MPEAFERLERLKLQTPAGPFASPNPFDKLADAWNRRRLEISLADSIGWWTGFTRRAAALAAIASWDRTRNIFARLAGKNST
jgi:hypothetical protein